MTFKQKLYALLNFGVIVTHHNCICVLVPSTLRMATWVANTCLWLLYNKIIFILPSGLVGLFKENFTIICLNLTVLWKLRNRNTKKLANSCLKLVIWYRKATASLPSEYNKRKCNARNNKKIVGMTQVKVVVKFGLYYLSQTSLDIFMQLVKM